MMGRLLLVVAVAANVSVAGMSVTASAWLWTRAAEPIAVPEAAVVPTVPSIVGETSVPYRAAAAEATARRQPAGSRSRAARARQVRRSRRAAVAPARVVAVRRAAPVAAP